MYRAGRPEWPTERYQERVREAEDAYRYRDVGRRPQRRRADVRASLGNRISRFARRRVAERETVVTSMTEQYCSGAAESGKPCVVPILVYKGRIGA